MVYKYSYKLRGGLKVDLHVLMLVLLRKEGKERRRGEKNEI